MLHDGDAIGQKIDDREVVGHEQRRELLLLLDGLQQLEHARLNRDIQRARGLVGHQHSGVEGQSAGDTDALTLPTRELVRVPVAEIARQFDEVQQILDTLGDLFALTTGELQRLPDRLSDGPAGVQRRTGVLEHDPELAAHRAQLLGAYPDHVLACNAKASLRDRYEAHDGARNGRLA
nr:hypothetical protein [Microbacterium sp.]